MAKQLTEKDYLTAQESEDATQRQDYLYEANRVNKDIVDGIWYSKIQGTQLDPVSGKKFLRGVKPHASFRRIPLLGINRRDVVVYPSLFEHAFGYFHSKLEDRATHILRQVGEHPWLGFLNHPVAKNSEIGEYFKLQTEICATLNQLAFAERRKLNEQTTAHLNSSIDILEQLIRKQAARLGLDWRADLSRILCASPHDDIVRERYGL